VRYTTNAVRFVNKTQKAQLSLGWADHAAYILRPESDFRLQEESNFLVWLQFNTCYGDDAISIEYYKQQ